MFSYYRLQTAVKLLLPVQKIVMNIQQLWWTFCSPAV